MLAKGLHESPTLKTVNNGEKLLIFDLSHGGHHPSYILYLIQYWCEQQYIGQLDIVVTPTFLQKHTDVVQAAHNFSCTSVRFVSIESSEESELNISGGALSKAMSAFKEWGLLCKYAQFCQADQALLMYFDTAQVPFVFGQEPPCPVSGIYFRPTFHYSSFRATQSSFKERIQVWRERFNLSRLVNRPKMGKLFCLDPFVADYINKDWKIDKAVQLADPVKLYNNGQTLFGELFDSLNIESERRVFLMFGALTKRKGVDQVLDAIALLPDELLTKFCLLMVGPLGANDIDKARLNSRISTLTSSSDVQVVVCDAFIDDKSVQPYFEISDFVLATYQKHIGMSNILIRAALSQKPVISSDYGLMGEITRQFELGLAVDSTNPHAISQALVRCITDDTKKLYNPVRMKQFGEQNLAEKFSSVIFQNLLKSSDDTQS